MKARHRDVAAVTEFGHLLETEHVSIRCPVWGVTGIAAFDSLSVVLEEKRPVLVPVAVRTGLLFEPPQAQARLAAVRIVAIDAENDVLLQAMSLVLLEIGEDVSVTPGAHSPRIPRVKRVAIVGGLLPLQRPATRTLTVHRVTGRAIEARTGMSTEVVSRVIGRMAGEAALRLPVRGVIRHE